ncbi:cupredoxin domain-containing protein [Actinomadura parmotrematis]|uniref:Cupredoxin domain-containing protein n=1 Tax=Actinomadura parmotrematis TaxID=2864039 RepID=A0ABS7FZY5_9ACTN|nr:cupredoxin domain-containing protein [Actinomadura parmotrematis]MBW8485866.1 cupredoxin domain-containing protein [Actinomadura parmotrematis]
MSSMTTDGPTPDTPAPDDREPVAYLGLPARLAPAPDGPAAPGPTLYRTAGGLVADGLSPSAGPGRLLRVGASPHAPAGTVRARDGLAESIVMGPVTVALDSHPAIAYGLRAGLLEAAEEPGGAPAGVRVEVDGPAALGVACTVRPARDADEAPASQRVLYGWFLGMPLVHNVAVPGYYGGTAPDEPDPALPSMRCYLTAPVDEAAPSSPVRRVPTAGGMRTLPSHQNTTDKHPGPQPHNNYGYFVVPGPAATEDTVRSRPAPPDGLPAEPLAYAMRLGGRWTGLNNHLVIEHGVATGLLALVPLEYGGQMWTSFPGRTQLAVECEGSGVVPDEAPARLTEGTLDIKKADLDLMGHRPNSPAAPGARRIPVSCAGLAFRPDRLRVRAGEDVAIELTATDVMHNLEIEDLGFYVQADAGETAVGGLRADRPGTYAFHCSLMAHRAAGMTGTLVVEP